MYENKKCFECGKELTGRTDKKFCEHTCRSNFHNRIYREEMSIMKRINKILKANRKIMEKLNPQGRANIHRVRLEKSGFDFDYFTHFHEGKGGKVYRFIYEYGYAFNDGETVELLIKKSSIVK